MVTAKMRELDNGRTHRGSTTEITIKPNEMKEREKDSGCNYLNPYDIDFLCMFFVASSSSSFFFVVSPFSRFFLNFLFFCLYTSVSISNHYYLLCLAKLTALFMTLSTPFFSSHSIDAWRWYLCIYHNYVCARNYELWSLSTYFSSS